MSNRPASPMAHYAHTCPICDMRMIKVGFCHLLCPGGHYQEVCSDLFMPTPAAANPPDQVDSPSSAAAGTDRDCTSPIRIN